jgi:hypothetical protein
MEFKSSRHRQAVISQCELASWRPGPERLSGAGIASELSAARIGKVMAHAGLKRRQLVERLLDRTLANYVDPDARRGRSD